MVDEKIEVSSSTTITDAVTPVPGAVPGAVAQDSDELLIEALAMQAHASWAGWIRWMMAHVDEPHPTDGSFRDRWRRQAETPYVHLSEAEKELDREEARHYLEIVRAHDRWLRERDAAAPSADAATTEASR